jgi:Right handed beta helix region
MKLLAVLVVSALAAVAAGGTVPAGAATTAAAVPASIPGDCSRDVTAELLAWIASVPDGSTLSFSAGACYRVDRTLAIRYRNGLTFEGNGATFRAYTSGRELPAAQARTRSMFNFWRGTNLTVRNTIVRGANPNAGTGDLAYVQALEAQTAYVIGGVQNMVLDHVEAYDVYGDFVMVGPATKNLLVKNSTFVRNGRQGWTINGEDIVFEHNNIRQTRRATIDIEPAALSALTRRVTIRNNTIGQGRLYFLANEGVAAPTADISILNNRFVNRGMTIRVNPPSGTRSRYRVVGNTSDFPVDFGSGGGAMSFTNVVDLEVRNNVQPMQQGNQSSGVAIKGSRNVTVSGNWFPYAKGPILSRGGNFNVAQSYNYVGNPLRLVAPTLFPGLL